MKGIPAGSLRSAVLLAAVASGMSACSSCGRAPRRDESATTSASAAGARTVGAADPGAPRPGMVWIAPGSFRAGTPPELVPRLADEEMPGVAVEMGGFYIDVLPYPDEPNAIPTTNVTRDEAEQLCSQKGKRLCTELEWERACKGPDASVYGYGDAYRPEACGTGTAIEHAARRPTGEHPLCKNAFGVSEMHGGVWEWTSSSWGRGSKDASQGVLRGGNSVAGELVGRCANGIARAPSKKSPTMGLRCCAGPKNAAEVKLDLKKPAGLLPASQNTVDGASEELVNVIVSQGSHWASRPGIDKASRRAWAWTPVGNEELSIFMGCTDVLPRLCGLLVMNRGENKSTTLAKTIVGHDLPELARLSDARHLRIRALDLKGTFSREITYVYGRVDLGDAKRP